MDHRPPGTQGRPGLRTFENCMDRIENPKRSFLAEGQQAVWRALSTTLLCSLGEVDTPSQKHDKTFGGILHRYSTGQFTLLSNDAFYLLPPTS